MKKRYLTAAVVIPLFSLVIEYGPPWLYAGFLFLVGALVVLEVLRILPRIGQPLDPIPAGAGTLLILLGAALAGEAGLLAGTTGALILAGLWAIFSRREPKQSLAAMLPTMALPMFLGFLFAHLILLRGLVPIGEPETLQLSHKFGKHLVFYLFAVVWFGDAAAMHVGKAWGRHKMAPVLSPKKTWEGLAAAVLGGLVGSFLFACFLGPGFSIRHRVLLGILLPLLGQAGDLSESVFKRAGDIKDSGGLLPGHGGFFDRVDSLLFSVPTLYYYVKAFVW